MGDVAQIKVALRDGLRVAFLSYADVPVEWLGFDTRSWEAGPESPGIAWLNLAEVAADVSNARRIADVVVVFMHFGFENDSLPSELQRAEARAAIDVGAALVVVTPSEKYSSLAPRASRADRLP